MIDNLVTTCTPPVPETVATTPDRFRRQRDIVPRAAVLKQHATVIGVGAGGRQAAWMLASMGVPRLQLIDFDKVENHNITTQGYYQRQIGQSKVRALQELIDEIDSDVDVAVVDGKFHPKLVRGNVIFCCVDSIALRQEIWESVGKTADFWVDGRMKAETLLIYTATNDAGRNFYQGTLFPESEAQVGACTERGTIYGAAISAGLMLHQFARYLRGMPTDHEQIFNLLAGELTVTP